MHLLGCVVCLTGAAGALSCAVVAPAAIGQSPLRTRYGAGEARFETRRVQSLFPGWDCAAVPCRGDCWPMTYDCQEQAYKFARAGRHGRILARRVKPRCGILEDENDRSPRETGPCLTCRRAGGELPPA